MYRGLTTKPVSNLTVEFCTNYIKDFLLKSTDKFEIYVFYTRKLNGYSKHKPEFMEALQAGQKGRRTEYAILVG